MQAQCTEILPAEAVDIGTNMPQPRELVWGNECNVRVRQWHILHQTYSTSSLKDEDRWGVYVDIEPNRTKY